MKVVYHPRYDEVYTHDPAAEPGRMECIYREVKPLFDIVEPQPASLEDVGLVHSAAHIGYVRGLGVTYDLALLAAGGAITAATLAVEGEPSFGLIRPPGHHASPDHCWGFCFFNNIAISVAKLRHECGVCKSAILDIDLHYGDGTANTFADVPEVTYCHAGGSDREEYMHGVAAFLTSTEADIIAVSAGFDRHQEDWGGLLTTEDYRSLGKLVKEFAVRSCAGRRYAVLEGGYNHAVLGHNVRAFLEGLS